MKAPRPYINSFSKARRIKANPHWRSI